MTPEHDAGLCQRFPILYADRNGSPKETLMCWGFECGDGWFELIRNLSEQLEALTLQLPEAERPRYRAVQVKQKFGMLRFYMNVSTPEMHVAIGAAEAQSAVTCENCGAPGSLRDENWVRTLCDQHHVERKE